MAEAKPSAWDEVRLQAWEILQKIGKNSTPSDLLFKRTFSQNLHWTPLDRAFLVELVQGTLRWRNRLDGAILRAARFPGKKIELRLLHLLRLGAYQIMFLDRVPDSAAVNETVRLAKVLFKNEKVSGFANAILRHIARNKDREVFPPFQDQPIEYLIQALSHPSWMVERWVKEFGPETTRKICAANNLRPPFTVRVNALKISRESLQGKMAAMSFRSRLTSFSPDGLVWEGGLDPATEDLFAQGFYYIQDEASQLIAHLVAPQPGERLLEACAAPGGKVTHMAQLMGDRGEIIALDLHDFKIDLIRENCRRLGIQTIKGLRADATQPLPFPADFFFDRILLDAPCTGLGTLHRNPEVKWRRRLEDVLRLQNLQSSILRNLCTRLKPGGILVYSTCTMTPEENDGVVEGFLAAHRDFQLEDLHSIVSNEIRPLIDVKGFLRTYPTLVIGDKGYRLDGFFAARMKKI